MHRVSGVIALAILSLAPQFPVHAAEVVNGPAEARALLVRAGTEAALEQSLRKTGNQVAAFCANCHGDKGNSSKPEVPNLAGQNPAYLLEQMQQFADGRRHNTFMQGMIKALNAQEAAGAVLFYAAQTVIPRGDAPAALVAQGGTLYRQVCQRCHGNEGRGNEQIARIAGQGREYLALTLQRYRLGGAGVRTNALMASNTRLLTDAHIEALTAYISSLP